MGIQVEFNPDLALRRHGTASRLEAECLPKRLIPEKIYPFLKKGQRNYWLLGEIPLVETKGEGRLSRPLASVTILAAQHFIKDEEVWTRGYYRINEVYNPDNKKVHFEGMNKR